MLLVGLIAAIIICVIVFFAGSSSQLEYDDKKEWVLFGNSLFRVEVVGDKNKQQTGLGKRESMCEDCGMLFVFDDRRQRSFWMKDMKFPLDIVWIDGDKIVAMEKNIPYDFSETINPSVMADKVLELNAGMASKLDVKIGDKVFLLTK